MDLLKWFNSWVTENNDAFSPNVQKELDILKKRIEIELQDSSYYDEEVSRQDKGDEMKKDVFNIGARDVFLSLVKIYLKDAKQIILSYQSSTSESSSISGEEMEVDYDLDEKEVSGSEETNLQSDSNGSFGTEHVDENSSSGSNCLCKDFLDSDPAFEDESTTSIGTPESYEKLRLCRKVLKKLASNILKLDKDADPGTVAILDAKLTYNQHELHAIKCRGDKRLRAAREDLMDHALELGARLRTVNPLSASNDQPSECGQANGQPSECGQSNGQPSECGQSNGQPSECGQSNASPADRIEQVRKLAERANEDMKLSLFDSRTDKDFLSFDEKLTDYLIRLDNVQCAGDQSLQAARKEVVRYIEKLICRLEVKLSLDTFLKNNVDDPSCPVTQNETLKRIQEVESLADNIDYLGNTYEHDGYVDTYFSVGTLLRKCHVQLCFIECHDDQQLLDKRQNVLEYVMGVMADQLEKSKKRCDAPVPHCPATSAKAFESIGKVEQESRRLSFHIEFGNFQSRTDSMYVYVEEALTKLLINLDSVDCDGNEEVRAARKKAVQYINELTQNLEASVPA